MTDDEFLGLAYDYEDSPDLDERLADEVGPMIAPAFTALLVRQVDGAPGYSEGMWVHGYPSIRSIVITHPAIRLAGGREFPGVVRSIPVGWRSMRDADAFRMACEAAAGTYERCGWKRRPHTIQGS